MIEAGSEHVHEETMLLLRPFLICMLLLATLPLQAGAQRGIGLYLDQDLLTPLFNEDRDYTTGVAVEFFEEQHKLLYPMDKLAGWLGDTLDMHHARRTTRRSIMLGSISYTPDDLARRTPIRDDRPYSSLLYFANKRVQADQRRAIGIEMRAGLLGTAVSREVQQALHQWWRDATDDDEPVDPRGWRHQISDGGEPTFRVRLSYSQLLAHAEGSWDLSGSAHLNLGYQTNAGAGLALRVGKLRSAFWSLPWDPINRGNFLPAQPHSEYYVWLAYNATAVAYDALLQGQFRDSEVTFNNDELNQLVHHAGLGLTLGWKPVEITFAVNAKSAELDVGRADRSHVWGGMYFMFSF
jgi:hypothetical protein